MTDRARVQQLHLRIERAMLARAQYRVLLASAETAVVDGQRDLRSLKARLARPSHRPGLIK